MDFRPENRKEDSLKYREDNAPSEDNTEAEAKKLTPWRLLPLAAVLAGAAIFFATGLHQYLTFEALREHRELLLGWVGENAALAAIAYVIAYAAVVVFVPPSGTVITLAGGFIFGALAGTFCVVIGATIGATVLFLVTKYSVGDVARKYEGPAMRKMEQGFHENELSYMLFLRLIPLFPFWLVNIAPAFLGVKIKNYLIGTFFGIIPGTIVYATVGAGLGTIFDANEELSFSTIMTPEIIAGLAGLAVLALLPVAYKKYKARP